MDNRNWYRSLVLYANLSVGTIFAIPALTILVICSINLFGVNTVFSSYISQPSLYIVELTAYLFIEIASKIINFIIPIFAIDLAIFGANRNNEMFYINKSSSILFKLWCCSGIVALYCAVSLAYLTYFFNLFDLNMVYSESARVILIGIFVISALFKTLSKKIALKG